MALSNFDTKIMKVVLATHHQGDIRYRMSRGHTIFIPVTYVSFRTLFKSASISN